MTLAAGPAVTTRLLEVAEHWCREGTRLGAEYTQAFVEATTDTRLDCETGDGTIRSTGAMTTRRAGVGLLLRHRGSWWYGSAPLSEPQALADQVALVAGPNRPRVPPPLSRIDLAGRRPSPWASPEATTLARHRGAGAESVRLHLVQDFYHRHRAIVDSHGVHETSTRSSGRQRCTASVSAAGNQARSFTRHSSPEWGPSVSAAELIASADGLARDALNRARGLLAAQPAGRRSTPVVLGPRVGAALLHELIGHALEVDNFDKNAAVTAGLLDSRLCPAPLQLVDAPDLAGGAGSQDTDDDGQPATRTMLVQDGMVTGRLTSLRAVFPDTAGSTGNGRRQDYTRAALPRATNTVVLPGPDRAEDLCSVPAEGLLYVAALSSAETVAARGDFCFSAAESYYLTPGGGRRPLTDVNLFGDTRTSLRKLVGIAADVEGDNVTCGKQGQSVLIGLHSPTMRFDTLDWWC